MVLWRLFVRYSSATTVPNALKRVPNLTTIPGPQQYPIVGSLPSYWSGKYDRLSYHKVLNLLYQEYGPVVKENFGDRTIVHVFEPEDIKIVSCNDCKIVPVF